MELVVVVVIGGGGGGVLRSTPLLIVCIIGDVVGFILRNRDNRTFLARHSFRLNGLVVVADVASVDVVGVGDPVRIRRGG